MEWWQSNKRIVVRRQPALTERELNAACAMGDGSHPLWRAIHQLIDTAEDNAIENATASMDPPGLLAGYVGGAAQLRLLREDLYARRELGLAQREEGGSKKEELRKRWDPGEP